MAEDIVTVLRERARWCSHNSGAYDRTGVPWHDMTSCLSCVQELAAADEIERLRSQIAEMSSLLDDANERLSKVLIDSEVERLRRLVVELRPYLESDVRCGLMCEPDLTHNHPEDCDDCAWYTESLAWQARLDAGELDEVPRG